MKRAIFQYKCRLCEETYDSFSAGKELAWRVLFELIYDSKIVAEPLVGLKPKMMEMHSGCKHGNGIGDLLGYKIVED